MTSLSEPSYERICSNPECKAEFRTRRVKQIYCSYDCYCVMVRARNAQYYKELRKAKRPISKICPSCHEEFETTKLRVKYCGDNCYQEARRELCRAYSQKLRDDYKADHPKTFNRECDLCGKEYNYKTKQGKYCGECKPLSRVLVKGRGPVSVPLDYQGLKPGEMLGVTAPKVVGERPKCFICGGEAESADTPCKGCI